jgi:hypothetical protein
VNLQAVRFAMAQALQPLLGESGNVNPYVSSQAIAPGIQIIPPGVSYDFAYGGGQHEWTFVIQGFVALTEDVSAQQLLDELSDPGANGVKGRLEADRTLGGTVASLRVVEQTPGRQVDPGTSGPMLLVEWRVQVYAPGG